MLRLTDSVALIFIVRCTVVLIDVFT